MTEQVRDIAIDELVFSESNPRKDVGDISELANSIREQGVLEPILVTPVAGNGHFAVVAGRRRWAASKMAGKTTVPAIVRTMTDDEAEAVSLVENLHREDLAPLEEAQGFARWLELKGKAGEKVTHDDLAKVVGKARSTVTNTLRLLKAPPAIRDGLKNGDLTPAHVRVLLKVADASLLNKLDIWREATVEDLEEEVARANDEWRLTGPATQERAKAALTKAREQYPNADITWAGDARGQDRVPLVDWFGDPPKAIVDAHIVDGLKKHDATCTCRAYQFRADIVRKGVGRSATFAVDFPPLVRVCIDKAGHRKYEQARFGGTPGHSIATAGKPKTRKITAASRAKAQQKKAKDAAAAGERALNGRGRFMSVGGGKVDPKLIKGGLEREPARLVLFAIASKFTSEFAPGWRAALWRRIEKLPLSDVKKRAANWTVWAAIDEIESRRDEQQELRELVLGHYGIAVKASAKKTKKKAAR